MIPYTLQHWASFYLLGPQNSNNHGKNSLYVLAAIANAFTQQSWEMGTVVTSMLPEGPERWHRSPNILQLVCSGAGVCTQAARRQGLSCSQQAAGAGSILFMGLQASKGSTLASSSPEGGSGREGMFHAHLLSLSNLPKFPQLV